jgi:2-polyprenyl-6-methoxyphenol hydroxylase-like FAD-dependent oxidoreductase
MYIGNIYDIPSLPTWHRGPVAIIGDAAHAVSPHSGQGASLALEDAMSLASMLTRRATTPEAAFAEFEQSRRARAEKIVGYGRRSGNQKRELGAVGAWLRDRFVSLLLPRLLRKNSDWMYDHTIRWTEAGSP